MDSLGPLIFLALVVLFVWWSLDQARPGAVAFEAPGDPKDLVVSALEFFSRDGWATTSQGDQSVTFSRSQGPGCLNTGFLMVSGIMLGVLLLGLGMLPGVLLLGIVLGLLYWIAAKRILTVSVVARADPSGKHRSIVNVAWSRNGGGRGPSLKFQQLVASATPAVVTSPPAPSVGEQIEEVPAGVSSGPQLPRSSTDEATMGQVADGSAEPVCIRCGRPDLTDRERSRNPVLCDACLSALQAI